MRWSRLKSLLAEVRAPELDLVIHCSSYRRESASPIGRYWIELCGESILDIPTHFRDLMQSRRSNSDAPIVTGILRWWLELPRDELLCAAHPEDRWGLVDVLRVSDRRVGKRSLSTIDHSQLSVPAKRVLEVRYLRTEET